MTQRPQPGPVREFLVNLALVTAIMACAVIFCFGIAAVGVMYLPLAPK